MRMVGPGGLEPPIFGLGIFISLAYSPSFFLPVPPTWGQRFCNSVALLQHVSR
jgi:hypothetical protein